MQVLADHGVIGQVRILWLFLETSDWRVWLEALDLRLLSFGDVGLRADAIDRMVWLAAQEADAVLITANRNGGPNSLDRVIEELNDATCLPVLTLANSQRITLDRMYAQLVAVRLIERLEAIESLRGAGRLYLP